METPGARFVPSDRPSSSRPSGSPGPGPRARRTRRTAGSRRPPGVLPPPGGSRPRSPARSRRRRPARRRAGCGPGWPRRCAPPCRPGSGGARAGAGGARARPGRGRRRAAQAPMPIHRAGRRGLSGETAQRSRPRRRERPPGASQRARRPGLPGPGAAVEPARRAGGGSFESRRTVQATASRTVERPRRPSRWRGSRGSTCRNRWGVPTAGSHQLRSPAMSSQA